VEKSHAMPSLLVGDAITVAVAGKAAKVPVTSL